MLGARGTASVVPTLFLLLPTAGTPCHDLRQTELDTSEDGVAAGGRSLQAGGALLQGRLRVYSPSPIPSLPSLEMTADSLSKT